MSILVDDQSRRRSRSTPDVLGFEKRTEIPLGEHSWLTVGSPEQRPGA